MNDAPHVIITMVSSIEVDLFLHQHPELVGNADTCIELAARNALASEVGISVDRLYCALADAWSKQFPIPLSMASQPVEFFSALELARNRWQMAVDVHVVKLREALGLQFADELLEDDLVDHGEQLIRTMFAVIRSANLQLANHLAQPMIFDILGKLAKLYSGHLDRDAPFCDIQNASAWVPSADDLRTRLLAIGPHHQIWIVPIGIRN